MPQEDSLEENILVSSAQSLEHVKSTPAREQLNQSQTGISENHSLETDLRNRKAKRTTEWDLEPQNLNVDEETLSDSHVIKDKTSSDLDTKTHKGTRDEQDQNETEDTEKQLDDFKHQVHQDNGNLPSEFICTKEKEKQLTYERQETLPFDEKYHNPEFTIEGKGDRLLSDQEHTTNKDEEHTELSTYEDQSQITDLNSKTSESMNFQVSQLQSHSHSDYSEQEFNRKYEGKGMEEIVVTEITEDLSSESARELQRSDSGSSEMEMMSTIVNVNSWSPTCLVTVTATENMDTSWSGDQTVESRSTTEEIKKTVVSQIPETDPIQVNKEECSKMLCSVKSLEKSHSDLIESTNFNEKERDVEETNLTFVDEPSGQDTLLHGPDPTEESNFGHKKPLITCSFPEDEHIVLSESMLSPEKNMHVCGLDQSGDSRSPENEDYSLEEVRDGLLLGTEGSEDGLCKKESLLEMTERKRDENSIYSDEEETDINYQDKESQKGTDVSHNVNVFERKADETFALKFATETFNAIERELQLTDRNTVGQTEEDLHVEDPNYTPDDESSRNILLERTVWYGNVQDGSGTEEEKESDSLHKTDHFEDEDCLKDIDEARNLGEEDIDISMQEFVEKEQHEKTDEGEEKTLELSQLPDNSENTQKVEFWSNQYHSYETKDKANKEAGDLLSDFSHEDAEILLEEPIELQIERGPFPDNGGVEPSNQELSLKELVLSEEIWTPNKIDVSSAEYDENVKVGDQVEDPNYIPDVESSRNISLERTLWYDNVQDGSGTEEEKESDTLHKTDNFEDEDCLKDVDEARNLGKEDIDTSMQEFVEKEQHEKTDEGEEKTLKLSQLPDNSENTQKVEFWSNQYHLYETKDKANKEAGDLLSDFSHEDAEILLEEPIESQIERGPFPDNGGVEPSNQELSLKELVLSEEIWTPNKIDVSSAEYDENVKVGDQVEDPNYIPDVESSRNISLERTLWYDNVQDGSGTEEEKESDTLHKTDNFEDEDCLKDVDEARNLGKEDIDTSMQEFVEKEQHEKTDEGEEKTLELSQLPDNSENTQKVEFWSNQYHSYETKDKANKEAGDFSHEDAEILLEESIESQIERGPSPDNGGVDPSNQELSLKELVLSEEIWSPNTADVSSAEYDENLKVGDHFLKLHGTEQLECISGSIRESSFIKREEVKEEKIEEPEEEEEKESAEHISHSFDSIKRTGHSPKEMAIEEENYDHSSQREGFHFDKVMNDSNIELIGTRDHTSNETEAGVSIKDTTNEGENVNVPAIDIFSPYEDNYESQNNLANTAEVRDCQRASNLSKTTEENIFKPVHEDDDSHNDDYKKASVREIDWSEREELLSEADNPELENVQTEKQSESFNESGFCHDISHTEENDLQRKIFSDMEKETDSNLVAECSLEKEDQFVNLSDSLAYKDTSLAETSSEQKKVVEIPSDHLDDDDEGEDSVNVKKDLPEERGEGTSGEEHKESSLRDPDHGYDTDNITWESLKENVHLETCERLLGESDLSSHTESQNRDLTPEEERVLQDENNLRDQMEVTQTTTCEGHISTGESDYSDEKVTQIQGKHEISTDDESVLEVPSEEASVVLGDVNASQEEGSFIRPDICIEGRTESLEQLHFLSEMHSMINQDQPIKHNIGILGEMDLLEEIKSIITPDQQPCDIKHLIREEDTSEVTESHIASDQSSGASNIDFLSESGDQVKIEVTLRAIDQSQETGSIGITNDTIKEAVNQTYISEELHSDLSPEAEDIPEVHSEKITVILGDIDPSQEEGDNIRPDIHKDEENDSEKELDLLSEIQSMITEDQSAKDVTGIIENVDLLGEIQSIIKPEQLNQLEESVREGDISGESGLPFSTHHSAEVYEINVLPQSEVQEKNEEILGVTAYSQESESIVTPNTIITEAVTETPFSVETVSESPSKDAKKYGDVSIAPGTEIVITTDYFGSEANESSEIKSVTEAIDVLEEEKGRSEQEYGPSEMVCEKENVSKTTDQHEREEEKLLQRTSLPPHEEFSKRWEGCPVDPKELVEEHSQTEVEEERMDLQEEGYEDTNLFPHNTLDVSAQKSRVLLRRKASIRKRQGQRPTSSEPEPNLQAPPVIRPLPKGLPVFPGKLPAFVPPADLVQTTPDPIQQPREEGAAKEELAEQPKKGFPKHAGFGIQHPMMMQELQARLHKRKPKE